MQYQIEKGIVIPERRPLQNGKTPLRIAMDQMDIGDSIVIEYKERTRPHPMAKQAGIRIAMRKLNDGNLRVWRVA
jgi:hypothetical protein